MSLYDERTKHTIYITQSTYVAFASFIYREKNDHRHDIMFQFELYFIFHFNPIRVDFLKFIYFWLKWKKKCGKQQGITIVNASALSTKIVWQWSRTLFNNSALNCLTIFGHILAMAVNKISNFGLLWISFYKLNEKIYSLFDSILR